MFHDAHRSAVKTFTEAKPMVADHGYASRRKHSLTELKAAFESESIDAPIARLIKRISRIPHCFTLQSCYGHFSLQDGGAEEYSVRLIRRGLEGARTVRYRIAYIAFCVQNVRSGTALLDDMRVVPDLDPEYIQFGSADWFWNSCVNTYVLQAEPERCRFEDSIEVGVAEAERIENARDRMYSELEMIVDSRAE
jgi:hypothetical protein